MKRKSAALLLLAVLLLSGCSRSPDTADIPTSALTAANTAGEGSLETVLTALGGLGCCACDIMDNISTANPQIAESWFSSCKTGVLIIYQVCTDGGFIRYDLDKDSVVLTRVVWKSGEARVTYSDRYTVTDSRLTARGWLIIRRSIPNNPSSGSLHDGYIEPVIMMRISPIDEKCRQLQEKYVSPMGYKSGLFAADWRAGNMTKADLNGAFISMYEDMYGKSVTYDNCPWQYDDETDAASVPAGIFETVIGNYFDLSPAQIREHANFDASTDTYAAAIVGLDDGKCSIPYPDVTGYNENTDGTITICVAAVDVHKATDTAFEHIVTVKPLGDRFVYVANEIK